MTDKLVLGWLPMPMGGMSLIQQQLFDSIFSFVSADANADAGGRGIFSGYTFASTGYIPGGRNEVCTAFIDKTDADWLLMLDWDVSFTPANVYDLLDAADERTIVSGCYVTYFGDDQRLRPCWFAERDGEEYVPVDGFVTGEVTDLTVCGMGFTIMHRNLLLAMREAADENEPWEWFGHDVIGKSRVGEDLTFCSRARAQGFKVKGHGGVLLGHTKAKTLTPFDISNESLSKNSSMPTGRLLNVGGGSKSIPLPQAYRDYQHVLLDVATGPDVDIICDARELTLDSEFDAVYASHVVEHFSEHDVPKVLAGMYRALKSGGTLEVRVPDLAGVIRRVADENLESDSVLYDSSAGPIRVIDVLYGHQASVADGQDGMRHHTAFTLKTLRDVIADAGFAEVRITGANLELEAHAVKP